MMKLELLKTKLANISRRGLEKVRISIAKIGYVKILQTIHICLFYQNLDFTEVFFFCYC